MPNFSKNITTVLEPPSPHFLCNLLKPIHPAEKDEPMPSFLSWFFGGGGRSMVVLRQAELLISEFWVRSQFWSWSWGPDRWWLSAGRGTNQFWPVYCHVACIVTLPAQLCRHFAIVSITWSFQICAYFSIACRTEKQNYHILLLNRDGGG